MKYLIISLTLVFSFMSSNAQIGEVSAISAAMSQGSNNGLKILIPESSKKRALKAWEKLMKKYEAKTNKIKKEEEYLSLNASIPSLSDRPISVYATFQETPEGVYMNAFFDMGGTYLNEVTNPEKMGAAKSLLKSYAKQVTIAAIKEKISEETKKLDRLKKEKKSLEKDKLTYENDIKNAKEIIEKREQSIIDNIQSQKDKDKELTDQSEATEKIEAILKKY